MHPLSVVKEVHPAVDDLACVTKVVKKHLSSKLVLHSGPERFHGRIVVAVADSTHALPNVPFGKFEPELIRVVLAASVRVEDQGILR